MPKLTPPKIVAFLQNQWFKNPEKIKKIIERTTRDRAETMTASEVREFYIKTFLFWGCLTGRRLCVAFGKELCDRIVWEECSKEIGGKSSAAFPADLVHMQSVVDNHKPDIVLAFGGIASNAAIRLCVEKPTDWRVICGPHPAARQGDVTLRLLQMAQSLKGV